MKILALTTNISRPSTRYRLMQYIPYLSAQGISVHTALIPKGMSRWNLISTAREYDAVFVQKKLFSGLELWFLSKKAKKIIYDFDDAVMYSPHAAGIKIKTRRYKRFRNIVSKASLIIAGNRYLSGQVPEKYSKKVIIVPTTVDVSSYPVKDYSEKPHEIIIGWIGTKSSIGYLKMVMPALNNLAEQYPHMQVKVVSDSRLDIQTPFINYVQWGRERELRDLLSFDIGVMPLPDNQWTKGKCGFKLIQYMSAGIPVVCSPVGVNKKIVKHGTTGFFAESSRDWKEYLIQLIKDIDLREKMGMAGREFVRKHYSLNYWGSYMDKRLKELLI